ncbi:MULTISPECIES: acyl-CoA synthetase [Pseudofrankia]|uniref:acyl-CoA synthetase n=1 Tax=Pseudofrankia TaxID=2994363 RepID=UPI000234B9DE|nr:MULTISPECIES: long-chain fatty acid--CoA ligase [Pseudofrankia]OHV30063.1 AMP-dependent synthetase [Pseudofrankia sp. EUN1h]
MNDHGIGSWTRRRARMVADKTALVESDRTVTYGELDQLAVRVGHGLAARGVQRGDRVAYLGLNSIDLIVCMIGTAKLGAVFVPLNTRLAQPELAAILRDCAPALLLHDTVFTDLVMSADVASLGLARVEVGGPAASGLASLMADDGTPWDEPIGLDDRFMIQYTSGTTGRAKGVQLSHGNITWNVVNLLSDLDVRTDEISLVTAPLFHTAALNQVLFPTLFKGGTSLIEPRFDPDRALWLIEHQRVTMLFGVTSMYLALAAVPTFADADLTSLRIAMTGGAPVPESVLRLWADRGLPLIQGYGLTETAPGATLLRGEDALRRLGSAGAGVFFADVRVVAPDGAPVRPGEPGEVQISGPNVTEGYWRNEQATRDAFTADGWLRSGDVAVVDDDGFLRIVDRLKDMYISGGENVYPVEVEQAIHTHPAVAECAVIGVPDAHWGEVGRAIVAPRAGWRLTEADLLTHLAGRLARYKLPRSVVIVAELPHSAAGKVLKSVLREEYR